MQHHICSMNLLHVIFNACLKFSLGRNNIKKGPNNGPKWNLNLWKIDARARVPFYVDLGCVGANLVLMLKGFETDLGSSLVSIWAQIKRTSWKYWKTT